MNELKLPEPDTHCLDDEGGRPIDVWSYSPELVRQIVAADRAQKSARHREELLAGEITIGNLQAQVASDDVYISEILTREKNAAIADRQNYEVRVRLEADLEQLKAANLRAQLEQAQPAPEPERKPMTESEMLEGRERTFSVDNPYCPCDRKTFMKVARYVEAFHGIKETP